MERNKNHITDDIDENQYSNRMGTYPLKRPQQDFRLAKIFSTSVLQQQLNEVSTKGIAYLNAKREQYQINTL